MGSLSLLPDPGTELGSPALQVDSYTAEPPGKPHQSEPHFTARFGQLAPSQGLAGTRTEEQLGSLPAGTPASLPQVFGSLPLGALVFCGSFPSVSTESFIRF